MTVIEKANLRYEKYMQEQDQGLTEQDKGDEIYCEIGELLQQINDEELAEKIDLLILEMSDADKKEYFVKGFIAGAEDN